MAEFLITLIGELLGALGISVSETRNTKKIDANIERLKNEDWFRKVYEDEKYHRLFFVNHRVRGYLQSRRRTRKLAASRQAREKFMKLLEKQLLKR